VIGSYFCIWRGRWRITDLIAETFQTWREFLEFFSHLGPSLRPATWFKVLSPDYSKMRGRKEMFESRLSSR
jgi:hypothetical protein